MLSAFFITSISYPVFSHAKITQIYFSQLRWLIPRHDIIRFDISMHKSMLMDNFDCLEHLFGDVENSCQIELSLAVIESLFQIFAQKCDHSNVQLVSSLTCPWTNVMDFWNLSLSSQIIYPISLPPQWHMSMWICSISWFNLAYSLDAVSCISNIIHLSKRTGSNTFFYFELAIKYIFTKLQKCFFHAAVWLLLILIFFLVQRSSICTNFFLKGLRI